MFKMQFAMHYYLRIYILSSNTMFENHKKVSLNIASEASYAYILSGQNLIKYGILASFWKAVACGQTGQF